MSVPSSSVPAMPASWYTIGEVAGLLGLTAHTLRFYEKEGLLRPRRHGCGGYRAYDDTDVRRLQFIRNAHDCGFPLDEIRELLALPEQGNACCADVRSLALQKKLQLEARIRSMQKMSRSLDRLIQACDDPATPLTECPILHGLHDAGSMEGTS